MRAVLLTSVCNFFYGKTWPFLGVDFNGAEIEVCGFTEADRVVYSRV